MKIHLHGSSVIQIPDWLLLTAQLFKLFHLNHLNTCTSTISNSYVLPFFLSFIPLYRCLFSISVITLYPLFSDSPHLPPQCTHGTKGLLETASRSPLLTSSCPQAKPQATPPILEPLPEIVPSPALEQPKTSTGQQPANTPHKHHSHHRSKGKQAAHHTHKTTNSSPRPHHSHSSRRKDSKKRDPKFTSLR